jgi:hypothetical protein
VILALAIDAEPGPAPHVPWWPRLAPVEETRAEEAPPEEAPPPATPAEAPRAKRARVWGLAAIQGVDFASLPAPTAGLGLRAAVDLGADRVDLRLATWLSRRAAPRAREAVGVDAALYTAGLRYCRWLTLRMVDVAPCAGVEGGGLVGSGFGAALSRSRVGRWLAPQIGLVGVVRPLPRFAVSLEVDGLALVFRDAFTVLGVGEIYRPPPATLRAAVGLEARFP